jgi:tetratricopeptide (TPR) repeat protein
MSNAAITTAHGIKTSETDPDALAELDRAIDHLLHFRADVSVVNDQALIADPDLPMARALRAYLGLLGTEADDAERARRGLNDWLATQNGRAFTTAERAHLSAAQTWLAGDMRGAGELLRHHTDAHPRDALALSVGHQIDFLGGDAVTLRDRVGGALNAWSTEDPHRAMLLGMYAFGLEEVGDYLRAFDVGSEAVETDAKDVWGIHAITHTYEMRGKFGAGTRFMQEREADWASGNFLSVHNWWHRALFLLEAGDIPGALGIYDAWLHNEQSAGASMELLDAAALLWRMYLEGSDQALRWSLLANAWASKPKDAYYAFNDAHAVMSYVGAGRHSDAQKVIDRRVEWLSNAPSLSITNFAMTRDVGLPVLRAIVDFGAGRYDSVIEGLYPIRYRINEFGGSHAQRDAVQRTLLEATLRIGRHEFARVLVSERINIKPTSPYNWRKQATLAEAMGKSALAATAQSRAVQLVGSGGE